MMPPDHDRVIDIVRGMESIFHEMNAIYQETFPAALYVAVVSANEMGMDRASFLKHCETLFDNDKDIHLKGLQ